MVFMDCNEYLNKQNMSMNDLLKAGYDVGIAWQDGAHHGGENFIRLNLALPFSKVKEAFNRMDKYIFNKD